MPATSTEPDSQKDRLTQPDGGEEWTPSARPLNTTRWPTARAMAGRPGVAARSVRRLTSGEWVAWPLPWASVRRWWAVPGWGAPTPPDPRPRPDPRPPPDPRPRRGPRPR